MENSSKKLGEPGCLKKNCWLVRNLNYAPYKRCQYCELKFRQCIFLHYQIISLILLFFILLASFLIEGKISGLLIISAFVLIIVYGYFFDKSTDKIIQANFNERKAKNALKELNEKLEEKVEEQIKELKRAYENLKKLDQAKSEFISMASHQLRTPLSIIKGYLSMLIEGSYGQISAEVKEKLINIFQSNERLIRVANELLIISEIELGKVKLSKELVQIEDLIQSCYEEKKAEAEKKKIKLIWQKSQNLLPKIRLDHSKIRKIILSLLDNSLKYTKQGEVEIKVKKNHSVLWVSIRDTGEGLTKEEQKNIFESFTRGEAGISYWVEGIGLNLYIAKKYLELHQGKIWAESSGRGMGSIFYIELPIS